MAFYNPLIRAAARHDAARITAIYDFHARHGTATFDTQGLPLEEMEAKIAAIERRGWPFLVAETGGDVVGYAYVTQFRERPAYAFTCENSIYVDQAARGNGVGRALLLALCDAAQAFGFRQLMAVIGGGEAASVRVHSSCGFERVGQMRAVGWKNGRWLDTVYMQRTLYPGSGQPPVFR